LVDYHCAPCHHDLSPWLDVSFLDCRDVTLVDFCIPDIAIGHIPDLYAGLTTQGWVVRPPLFLHNITTWLGRHIYIYIGTHYHVSRLCRHIWTLAGIRLICRPGRYSYMLARPNLGQPSQSQPLSSYLYSLLTLPGVIPPTITVALVVSPRFTFPCKWNLHHHNLTMVPPASLPRLSPLVDNH
jgi:hypothetical protein